MSGRASNERRGRASKPAEEPVYLASQLASICDVDLKTIHNWCDRNDDPEAPAELESFRTKGGHLRFLHGAVLRFLTRWGYPIPNELLQDKPHVLLVEPDVAERRRLIEMLHLVRPGDDLTQPGARTAAARAEGDGTLGLWASVHYYLHLWDDAYAALVALGERTGAAAPPDLVVLALPMHGLDPAQWVRVARARVDDDPPRFVLVTEQVTAAPASLAAEVVRVVPRAQLAELVWILDQEARHLLTRVHDRLAQARQAKPRRRVPIAPREPIFVASQVASIWGVDLKTVHNWVERGDMEAFRTPGRHLRFRRRSLLSFLRRYNMEIPAVLAPVRPTVLLVDGDAARARALREALTARFEVLEQPDAVTALAELGMRSAGAAVVDAVVLAVPAGGVDARRWLAAVLRHPDTRYARAVVVDAEGTNPRAWHELGATATVAPDAIEHVAPVLEQALGLVQR